MDFAFPGDSIVKAINEWVTRIIVGRWEKKEKDAANILSCAGNLVQISRRLEGDYTKIMNQVYLLTADSPQQSRDDFIKQLNAFTEKTDFVDGIKFCLNYLRDHKNDVKNARGPIVNIIEQGQRLREQAGDSRRSPFADPNELIKLLD